MDYWIRSLCSLAACSAALSAQTLGATLVAGADTTLYENSTGSVANGGGQGIFVGRTGGSNNSRRRALIQFDIASTVPAGSIVIGAQLELFVAQSSASQPINVDAHRVQQSWSEGSVVAPGGGGSGGAAAAGESTWIHRDYPNVFWNTPGGDFAATPNFSFDMPTSGVVLCDSLAGLVSDVQDMVDNPSTNFGWLLKTDEAQSSTARRLSSREALGSGVVPRLNIFYLPPGGTGQWGTGSTTPLGAATLSVGGPATGGTTLPIVGSNLPTSSLGATFFTLALDPIGTSLGPNATTYLPLASTIIPGDLLQTTSGGGAASSLNLPAGFPGFLIVTQAAVIDASPLGFVLTKAGVMHTQ